MLKRVIALTCLLTPRRLIVVGFLWLFFIAYSVFAFSQLNPEPQSKLKLNLSAAEQTWLKQHPVIRLGIDRNFAPYEWLDDKGNYVGLVAEMMTLLEQQLGIKFAIIKDKAWYEILMLAQHGQLDMIACAVKTPEREAYLAFSQPYLVNPVVIISSDANGYFGDLNYLKARRVAVEKDYFMQELLQRDYPQINLVITANVKKALQQVAEGHADAYVGDAASASYAIRTEGYLHLRFAGQTEYKSIHSVAVTKTNPLLLTIVEKALATIPAAKKEAMITHWMGLNIEQGISVGKVSFYAGVVTLLFVLFMIWNHWLYKEINARRQAEQALRDSEAKLLAILDAEPECVKVTDAQGRLLQMNHAGLVMVEAEDNPAAVLGAEVEQLIVEPYRIAFRQMNERVLNGDTGTLVFQIKGLKGGKHWVETQAVPLLDTVSKKLNVLAVTRDITKRKRAEQREQARHQVRELLIANAPLKKILTTIVKTFEQDNSPMLASIMLVNHTSDSGVTHVSPSLSNEYMAEILTDTPYALFGKQQQIIANIQTEANWQKYQQLAAQAQLVACWSTPIKNNKGQLLGIFAIYHSHEVVPTEDDLQLLQQTAQFIGITLDRSYINDEQKIAQLVYQNSSEAMVVTNARGVIISVNHAFTELTGYSLEEAVGKSTRLLNSGKQSRAFYQAMWQAINSTGRWQGEILNRRKDGKLYTEWLTINSIFNDDGTVDRRVALFSDISHKKESEYLIWKQANFDLLTDLPNRRMFQDRLEHEIKKSDREKLFLALLIIDLDRFKEINDALGHAIGDLLLKKVGYRLRACVRESDTVARLGGDEFTVILGDLHSLTYIDLIAQSILDSFSLPFQLHNEVVYISVSIGIAIYPDDATDVGELLKSADQAMYAAKNQGRNRYSYFAPFMQEAAKVRMRIATDLRNALKKNEFRVFYQPIVSLKTGEISKAEALIRWQHPVHGLISPASFIPIAEETDMIVTIGNWVFEQAASQVMAWRTHYDAQFQISVNKSPVQFQSMQSSHQAWFAYLKKIGLSGDGVVIEITEGLLMDTSEAIVKQLIEFRNAGMQVSLDDFGTGYSSLSYLKKFNIDYLKIDQSFVRNMQANSNDLALCEAIIVMAHKLGIKVIAEGIETVEQRDLLTHAGCDYGQGYLFSHPLSATEFEKFF